jgi:hypothetical protein
MTNTVATSRPTISFPTISFKLSSRTITRIAFDTLLQVPSWDGEDEMDRASADSDRDALICGTWSDGKTKIVNLLAGDSITFTAPDDDAMGLDFVHTISGVEVSGHTDNMVLVGLA